MNTLVRAAHFYFVIPAYFLVGVAYYTQVRVESAREFGRVKPDAQSHAGCECGRHAGKAITAQAPRCSPTLSFTESICTRTV